MHERRRLRDDGYPSDRNAPSAWLANGASSRGLVRVLGSVVDGLSGGGHVFANTFDGVACSRRRGEQKGNGCESGLHVKSPCPVGEGADRSENAAPETRFQHGTNVSRRLDRASRGLGTAHDQRRWP